MVIHHLEEEKVHSAAVVYCVPTQRGETIKLWGLAMYVIPFDIDIKFGSQSGEGRFLAINGHNYPADC